jgi:hypothetical protein
MKNTFGASLKFILTKNAEDEEDGGDSQVRDALQR